MTDLKHIREIAENVGLSNIAKEIDAIDYRSKQEKAALILPLVGEFSSGKTTLINALTDSKKLETATKPTTATIYEVHFGCDSCHAKVLNESNEVIEFNDISDLKNDALGDATVVTVFDTSNKVPASTILVDTPGLSSPDPKHKQTLVDFLPKSDAILLVSDINQQLTRSCIEFVKTMSLSKRPIYLVLTKSDTKSSTELYKVKDYILNNIDIKFQGVAFVSAANGELSELYKLFDSIQKDKNNILKQVNEQRIKNCVSIIIKRIDELLNSSGNDKEADSAIQKQKHELDTLKRNIENLADSMREDISSTERDTVRRFDDTVFDRLDTLAANKSANFDAEAVSIINCTSSLLFNDYKMNVQELLRSKVNERVGTDQSIDLHSLAELELSKIGLSGFSYNLNLNEMGHEYDGMIANGVKVAAVAAAAVAIVAAAPVAGTAVAGTTAAGTTAAEGAATYGLVDIAGDVFNYYQNSKEADVNKQQAQQIQQLMQNTPQPPQTQTVQQAPPKKGIVEGIVGSITDKTMGKPQRRRAIHDYIDGTLLPEFKIQLQNISNSLINFVRNTLNKEAEANLQSMTKVLDELIAERKNKKEAYQKRINDLLNYKIELQNI